MPELTALGYRGGYGRVAAFARRLMGEESMRGSGCAFVPLKFQLGEAFQFDWSTEYAFVGGLRRRLDVAHTKLCASRDCADATGTQELGNGDNKVSSSRTRKHCHRMQRLPSKGKFGHTANTHPPPGRGKLTFFIRFTTNDPRPCPR